MAEKTRRACLVCGKEVTVKKDGGLFAHSCHSETDAVNDTAPTADQFSAPSDAGSKKVTWFPASFDADCDTCGETILEGDLIRADGQGGWECCEDIEDDSNGGCLHAYTFESADACTLCGKANPDFEPPALAPAVADLEFSRHGDEKTRGFGGAVADLFTQPAAVASPPPKPGLDPDIVAAAQQYLRQDEDDYRNVSGQPKARYEWHGKQKRGYACADPRTGKIRVYPTSGKPKGWTRATTFNKAASDSVFLNDWGKRNVLIGAALRPDLAKDAEGLTHDDKGRLGSIIAQLEAAAGAKVAADWGTVVHEITELWDGGVIKSVDEVPEYFRGPLKLYIATLEEHGLVPVPGLIERTVFCDLFDGIAGTFDRVYLHEPSGQYIVGDLKTGKTLEYGMDEIETQEWLYAYGFNRYGVYDWNADRWVPYWWSDGETDPEERRPIIVSEEVGVIIHLPSQGEAQGTCRAVRADLVRGRRHAEVCHDVRVERSNKPKPEPFTADLLATVAAPEPAPVVAELSWPDAFAAAGSRAELGSLWQKAYDAGLSEDKLAYLKYVGDQRLTQLSG